MTRLYLAGPLFSAAELEFNRRLAAELTSRIPHSEMILPQDRAKTLLSRPNGTTLVFRDCLQMIDESDAIVAILDGSDADSGTCIELGYAYAKQKPVVGLRTDFRASEEAGLNIMVSQVCAVLLREFEGDLSILADKLAHAVQRVLHG